MSSFAVARLFAGASLVFGVGVGVAVWVDEPWRVTTAYVLATVITAAGSRMEAQRVRRGARRRRVYRVVSLRSRSLPSPRSPAGRSDTQPPAPLYGAVHNAQARTGAYRAS